MGVSSTLEGADPGDKRALWGRWLEVVALLAILALAAYLRLVNLADNPGWYTDEGTHLDIAHHMLQGQIRYLAITQSTLLAARLPLFDLLLAGLLGVVGGDIATLRGLTGVLGVTSVGLTYWLVRRTQRGSDPALALLSALMLTIYPQAVLYSRLGFSYNLLAPLVLLTTLALWEYLSAPPQRKLARRLWLALAALATGTGLLSDLWMITMIAPLMLAVVRRPWRDLLWSLPLALLPFSLYAAFMLSRAPQAFLFDLRFILFRVNRLSLLAQARNLALNYSTLVLQDAWIALAVVGLFLLRPDRLRRLSLLVFLLPIGILGRTLALYSLSFHYMIPLLPFVGLGIASLIRYGIPYVAKAAQGALSPLFGGKALALTAAFVLLAVIATPFVTSLASTASQARTRFTTQIDPFLLDPDHARSVAEYVNGRTNPDDVVIASPTLAWLLKANVGDVQMATIAAGHPAPDLPPDIPAERFAFDPHYAQARFVIVDNLWHNWAVWNVPGVLDMVEEVQAWPLAFQAGEIMAYANPGHAAETH